MKKIALLVIALLAMSAFMVVGASAADNTMSVTMNAQNGSGQTGTATLTQKGDADVMVTLNLSNGTSVAQPAHIHKGSCANLDPKPLYPLTNVVDGKSDTEVMVSMADLEKGGYAINIHKSAAEVSVYTSCGDIKAMMMSGGTTTGGTMSGGTMTGNGSMPGTGAGDQPMFLVLLGLVALSLTGAGLKLSRSAKR